MIWAIICLFYGGFIPKEGIDMHESKIGHDVMDWSVDIEVDVCNDIVEAEIEASQRIILGCKRILPPLLGGRWILQNSGLS